MNPPHIRPEYDVSGLEAMRCDLNSQAFRQQLPNRCRDAIRTLRVRYFCLLGLIAITSLAGCKRARVSDTNSVSDANESQAVPSIRGLAPTDAVLDIVRQRQVWDAEHATHLIEHRFGVRFRELLKAQSTDLADLIDEDAVVTLINPDSGTNVSISTVRSSTSDGAHSIPSSSSGLVSWLIDLYSTSAANSKYSLRVLAIEAGKQETEWQASLLLTSQSRDSDGAARIETKHRVKFRWLDSDDLESATVSEWHVKSVTQSSSPAKLMAEVTRTAGLSQLPIQDNWKLAAGQNPQMIRFQMAVADYDADGLLDIAVSSAGNNLLLRLAGGKFTQVTDAMGIHPISRGRHVDISASWLDFDNDRFPDLILGGRVYHNDKGKRFVDVTEQCGIEFHPHHMGCTVADYNTDGLLDVYFIYAHDSKNSSPTNKGWIGDEESGGRNQLWKNQGDGTFVDATDEAGVGGGLRQSFAANWLFADEDHFPDLYVANDFGSNSLFRNRGDGTFEDISTSSGTSDFATSMGLASGDLDNDGTTEIYVANMYSKMGRRIVGQVTKEDYPAGVFPRLQGACAGSRLYRLSTNAASSTEFSEFAGVNQVGWAYAPAMTDFNNDGLLDLYATCGFLSVDRTKPDG